MAAWPPLAIYAVVAAAAVIENIFPPAPADMVITLAAFLSHRGETSALTVFLVTWVANVGGACLVYVLARRFGERFFASSAGRRLMTPEAVVAVERNYLRFGLAGLFVARLLPGFRSFTAPFAGLIRLGPVRTLVPIGVASALWYGTLVYIGARLGESWEAVERLIAGLNRTLAVVAGLAALALAAWYVSWHRRRRRERLRVELEGALGTSYPALEDRALEDPAAAAVAALLLETTLHEGVLSPEEVEALEKRVRESFGLAEDHAIAPVDPAAVAGIIARLEPPARVRLFRRLRDAVFPDDTHSVLKQRVMVRAARLLQLDPPADQPPDA